MDVFKSDGYLMIRSNEVQFRKKFLSSEVGGEIIYVRQWVVIESRDCIEASVVIKRL